MLLARADAGQVELRHETVDLTALADQVAEMYQPLAEEQGVSLVWDHPTPVPVRGDPARLRQLVTNLVDNAIKFTEPGGTVAIRLERAGDRARLGVVDTGVGIPAEHLPHVFERFYQSDPARSVGGTGLGLSICRWIAEAHGGSIRATSEPGRGSTFAVLLRKRRAIMPDKPTSRSTLSNKAFEVLALHSLGPMHYRRCPGLGSLPASSAG